MKITSRTVLRFLVVAEAAFVLMGVVSDLVLEDRLPQEIQQYIARTEAADMTLTQIVGYAVGLPLVIGVIIGWIGLWRLWRPARFIYTLCWLLGLPLYLLFEPAVCYTPLGAIFNELSVLAAGIILGVVYFSDLAAHFTKA